MPDNYNNIVDINTMRANHKLGVGQVVEWREEAAAYLLPLLLGS